MHMVGILLMMNMNLTMVRYLHAKGARKAKPKSEGLCSACGSSTHKHRDCPKRSTAKTCYCSCGFPITEQ